MKIGPTCALEFLDTPGHAKHHFSIYDPISNGMFTGGTVGVRYEQLISNEVHLLLPSTLPNQFDPEAMQSPIERMKEIELDFICFGHYGMTDNPNEALRQVANWLDIFVMEARSVYAERKGQDELVQRLLGAVRKHLRKKYLR